MMITLEEALDFGRGIERPFCCPKHPDMHASASVNVVKGVWYCYACSEKGRVDGKRVPTDIELAAMLRPEEATRIYPASWLSMFTSDATYWQTRFPDWLCSWADFGADPVTGDATFPVYTADGKLAGVGRRREHGEPRYLYPANWSASRTLGFLQRGNAAATVGFVLLVEGYADGAACWQVGAPALSAFGAGVHLPQRELVARIGPKLIVNAFDADGAGRAASERTYDTLCDLAEIVDLDWEKAGGKDPAALDADTRTALVIETVRRSTYGANLPVEQTMGQLAGAVLEAANRKE